MRVYGIVYWADVQCVDCAENDFNMSIDDILEDETIKDPEGNGVTPLYSWDISEDFNCCGTCFEKLID
jgi:hypothetical protein